MENENAKVKKMPKGLIIGLVAAVVIIAIGIVLFIFKPWLSGYVGTVDGLKITEQEYIVFTKGSMNQFLSTIPNNTITPDKYDWNTPKNGEPIKEQIKKETLNQIQEIKILMVKAKEAGVKIEAEDQKTIDSNIVQQFGTEETAEEVIKSSYNVSLADYKKVLEVITLSQKYYNSLNSNSKITVPDDEVKKYYDDNKNDFDKATITHIIIPTVDANNAPVSAGKKSEAKKKADELVAKIKAGGDIKALVKENASSTTTENGELTFEKGQLSSQYAMFSDLENWAFENKVGEVGLIDAAYGYEVVKLEKRVETAYDEVKDRIKSSLNYSKFAEDFGKKLEDWKKEKQYEIVKNDNVLKKVDLSIYGA
ncbi:MAG: peptidyl-prolyl cis-trans isomerase [Ruminiclostridium sp.]